MKPEIATQEQIDTTIAIAIMKKMLNDGKITDKVYNRILSKYSKKGLEFGRPYVLKYECEQKEDDFGEEKDEENGGNICQSVDGT